MATTLAVPPLPQRVASVEPYQKVATQLHSQGVEGTAILQRLRERGYAGTLSSACRFLRTQAKAPTRQRCLMTAGQRRHGTTKEASLDGLAVIERAQLKPLPALPYDLGTWKQVKLHRDCSVVFEQAFYSAPFRLSGQRLWMRGGSQEVRLHNTRYELVETHPRAPRPGACWTHESG